MHQIPSDNQIRNLLDSVAPSKVLPVFEEILRVLDEQGQLDGFRSVSETLFGGDGWHGILQFDSTLLSAVLNAKSRQLRHLNRINFGT